MKKLGEMIGLILLASVLAEEVVHANSDVKPEVFLLFHELKLVSFNRDAPSTFKLFYSPGLPCNDNVSATVTCWDYTQKYSEQKCNLEVLGKDNQGFSGYTATFNELIPENDTTQLWITLECDTFSYTFKHFFVTTGDTVEYRKGDPRELKHKQTSSKTNDPIRDTLTQEQLQTKYEVLFDLRDPEHFKIAEDILGSITGSRKYENCDECYILNVTLENIFMLGDRGIEAEFTVPPPWSQRYRALIDNTQQQVILPLLEINEINKDTLTSEQLLKEYKVVLWFRDSVEQKFVENIIGILPDSAKISARLGLYRLIISLENILKIRDHKIEIHFEPSKQKQKYDDYRKDSTKQRGNKIKTNSLDGFSLEYVEGEIAPGIISTNQEITFFLRINNNTAINMEGMTNELMSRVV